MEDFQNRLTPGQWNCFCSCNISIPVRLGEADLRVPFVYERQFGVFYVPSGYHQSAMSFLLAIQNGCDNGIQVGEKLGLNFSGGTADYWLENTPGAAFRSSVGKSILVGSTRGLTIQERRLFGNFKCIL